MSIDVNSIINNIGKNYNSSTRTTSKTSTTVDSNIFAQASALVAQYKAKQESDENSSSSSSSGLFSNMTASEMANMSTSDFLKYAYNNQSSSGFESSKTDSSGIKLPLIVRYKGEVVSTAGKTFMAVVAKFKAKYPHRSEEEIAAELMAKYGGSTISTTSTSTTSTTGNSVNLSA